MFLKISREKSKMIEIKRYKNVCPNVEADVSRGGMGGGGGNLHTLHTKCEKQWNLHIKRGMISQI